MFFNVMLLILNTCIVDIFWHFIHTPVDVMSYSCIVAQSFNFVVVQMHDAGVDGIVILGLFNVPNAVVVVDAHDVHVGLFFVEYVRPQKLSQASVHFRLIDEIGSHLCYIGLIA